MKKLFLFLLTITALSCVSYSQDTVRYGDPWYQFNLLPPLTVNSMYAYTDLSTYYMCGEGGHYMRAYLGYEYENNVIYGIAVVMDSLPGLEWNFIATLLRGMEYHDFYIDIEEGIPWYPGSIVVDSCYREDSIKTWEDPLIKRCRFEYFYNYDSLQSDYKTASSNCYEFYFDTPISKTKSTNGFADTFFVGINFCRPNRSSDYLSFTPIACKSDSVSTPYLMINRDAVTDEFDMGWYHTPSKPCLSFGATRYNFWGGIFPIIERRCSVPRGLTLVGDSQSVYWRSDTDAELFQLSLCTDTVEPDFGRLFTTSSTALALPSLHPDSTYRLYLRKQCAFRQDSVWSDWSEPLLIEARPSAAIDDIDHSPFIIQLSPNPTDGPLTIQYSSFNNQHSPFPSATLTLTDLLGREIQTIKQSNNQTITLDLSPLPPATYLLRIQTPAGPTTKKLIIQ